LNVDLDDGEFRQYAVLPNDLFGTSSDATLSPPAPTRTSSPPAPPQTQASDEPASMPLDEAAVRKTLAPLMPALAELGATVEVDEVSEAQGYVIMQYEGPPKHKRSIEMLLRNDFRSLKRVIFVLASASASASVASAESPVEVAASAPMEVAASAPDAQDINAPQQPRFKSQPLEASDVNNSFARLHKQGWVVLKDRTRLLDEATLKQVQATSFTPIFNGHAEGEAPLRFMGKSYSWSEKLAAVFTEGLSAANLLQCSDGVSMKQVNDCYALRSLPCDEDAQRAELLGRQPGHSDLPDAPEGSKQVAELADEDVPLSVLLAIQPGTKLWIFPNGCEEEESAFLARLEVGEMMVWRGDLVHAGAGYSHEHIRVHAYVDPPATYYARPKGKTNLCRPR